MVVAYDRLPAFWVGRGGSPSDEPVLSRRQCRAGVHPFEGFDGCILAECLCCRLVCATPDAHSVRGLDFRTQRCVEWIFLSAHIAGIFALCGPDQNPRCGSLVDVWCHPAFVHLRLAVQTDAGHAAGCFVVTGFLAAPKTFAFSLSFFAFRAACFGKAPLRSAFRGFKHCYCLGSTSGGFRRLRRFAALVCARLQLPGLLYDVSRQTSLAGEFVHLSILTLTCSWQSMFVPPYCHLWCPSGVFCGFAPSRIC